MNAAKLDKSLPTRKRRKSKECSSSDGELDTSEEENKSTSCSAEMETMKSLELEINMNASCSKSTEDADTDGLVQKLVSVLDFAMPEDDKKKTTIVSQFDDLKRNCQEKYLGSKEFELKFCSTMDDIQRDRSNVFNYLQELCEEMNCDFTSSSRSELVQKLERHIKLHRRLIKKMKMEDLFLDEDGSCMAYIIEDKINSQEQRLSTLQARHRARLENENPGELEPQRKEVKACSDSDDDEEKMEREGAICDVQKMQ